MTFWAVDFAQTAHCRIREEKTSPQPSPQEREKEEFFHYRLRRDWDEGGGVSTSSGGVSIETDETSIE